MLKILLAYLPRPNPPYKVVTMLVAALSTVLECPPFVGYRSVFPCRDEYIYILIMIHELAHLP